MSDKNRGIKRMTQVKCDFCGELVRESEAEQSVAYVGFFGFLGDETKEIEHFYCNEQHKALYFFQEHLARYGSRETALNHLVTMHGLVNIRRLVKAYVDGDPLPDVEVIEVEEEAKNNE